MYLYTNGQLEIVMLINLLLQQIFLLLFLYRVQIGIC